LVSPVLSPSRVTSRCLTHVSKLCSIAGVKITRYGQETSDSLGAQTVAANQARCAATAGLAEQR
jgi:hypothetical protein